MGNRQVRKDRAPKGALRPRLVGSGVGVGLGGQNAPSAKRCIMTLEDVFKVSEENESESTERQKLH